MSSMRLVGLAVGLVVSAGAAQAGLINAGFESGLTGWTVGTLTGAGAATVVTDNTTNYSPPDWGASHTFLPFAGNYFLAIEAGAGNDWQEVTQTVTLAAGETIGGVARFDWGDYYVAADAFPDGAKVEILDGVGAFVALPFYLDGTTYCPTFCDHETGGAGSESPWTPWSFTASAAGDYTVVYAARNTSDGGGPNQTFGYFDNAGPASVPEPNSLALLGLGLGMAGLAAVSRRRRS